VDAKIYTQTHTSTQIHCMCCHTAPYLPVGKPGVEDLLAIRTRKPEPPVLLVTLADGTHVPLWCTFSPQQVRGGGWRVCWVPVG
jgi:hypothetical protein